MIKRGVTKDFAKTLVTIYVIQQVGTITARKVNSNAEKILGRRPRSFQTYIKDYQKYFK